MDRQTGRKKPPPIYGQVYNGWPKSIKNLQGHVWPRLTRQNQLKTLQELENMQAAYVRRAARIVDVASIREEGGYNRAHPKTILLDHFALTGDPKDTTGGYRVADALFKEGYHALQDDVIAGRIESHPGLKEKWTQNRSSEAAEYLSGADKDTERFFQPLERETLDHMLKGS